MFIVFIKYYFIHQTPRKCNYYNYSRIIVVWLLLLWGCSAPDDTVPDSQNEHALTQRLNHAIHNTANKLSHTTLIAFQRIVTTFATADIESARRIIPINHIQHNPAIADGRDGLITMLQQAQQEYGYGPHFLTGVRHIVMESGIIVLHRVVNLGIIEMAMFNVLRFDPYGAFIENWDFMQPLNPSILDKVIMHFQLPDGLSLIPLYFSKEFDQTIAVDFASTSPTQTATNKQIVLSYLTHLYGNKNGGLSKKTSAQYIHPLIKVHRSNVVQSIDGYRHWMTQFEMEKAIIEKIVAQNDLVWALSRVHIADDEIARADLFRVHENKIIEQWRIVQPSTDQSRNSNGLF